jgi:hypothetical protein
MMLNDNIKKLFKVIGALLTLIFAAIQVIADMLSF